MNQLEFAIITVTLLLAVSGFRRGFVKKLAPMVSLLLSIVLVSVFLPYITNFLKEHTQVYEYIVEQCEKTWKEQSLDDAFRNASEKRLGDALQGETIDELLLPDMLKNLLRKNNTERAYQALNVSTFPDYVTAYIATILLNVLAYIVSLIVVQILLWLVLRMLDILSHIPVIHFLNRLAGFGIGVLEALFFLWIFFMLLSVFSMTEIGMKLMSMVQESPNLTFLYESNLFMRIVLQTASLFA